jgi:3-dehydroquinate synthase
MADLSMSDSLRIKSLFRNYNVHFVGDFTLLLQGLVDQHAFFIIDPIVWEIYKEKLKGVIPGGRLLIVEANENNKSFDKCRVIIETLVDRQVRRNERLVAMGGGIIQDVTAFSASIIYRGIDWAFFPTTLLAQADSCIGSKTSINLGDKKNLVGNFYPPSDVFIDVTFLTSLTVDDIKSGIGEILHYYLYAASSLFDELISDYEMIIRDRNLLMKYIRESLKIKKAVIENDEFDRGERNKFNYGHTFGHAIESVTDYAIKHGHAVTVGMDLANYVSMGMGFMRPEIFHNLHAKLSINFPEFDWNKINLDRYLDLLSKDKKNVGNSVGCILAKDTGILLKQQLPLDDHFREMIHAYFSGQALSCHDSSGAYLYEAGC